MISEEAPQYSDDTLNWHFYLHLAFLVTAYEVMCVCSCQVTSTLYIICCGSPTVLSGSIHTCMVATTYVHSQKILCGRVNRVVRY